MRKYNKIMGVFTKTIEKLDKVIESNTELEGVKTAQIKDLKAECVALSAESTKCMVTSIKLKELLS